MTPNKRHKADKKVVSQKRPKVMKRTVNSLKQAQENSPFNVAQAKVPAERVTNAELPKCILVLDVGGTHVKLLTSEEKAKREFSSGPEMTPAIMVNTVRKLAKDWHYDAVSIGYPGTVLHGKPLAEPFSLGDGWVGFDFAKAFGCPVKLINDAAMQAMGSYEGGRMLFLGLGTGLGSTMIADGIVEPMEIGHLPYKKHTYEHYLGKRGVEEKGWKRWRKDVWEIAERLFKALEPDYIVIGGGDSKHLKDLPPKCRVGENSNAFKGGFLLWGDAWQKYLDKVGTAT